MNRLHTSSLCLVLLTAASCAAPKAAAPPPAPMAGAPAPVAHGPGELPPQGRQDPGRLIKAPDEDAVAPRITPDADFRQKRPAAGPERPFSVPAVKRFKLKN